MAMKKRSRRAALGVAAGAGLAVAAGYGLLAMHRKADHAEIIRLALDIWITQFGDRPLVPFGTIAVMGHITENGRTVEIRPWLVPENVRGVTVKAFGHPGNMGPDELKALSVLTMSGCWIGRLAIKIESSRAEVHVAAGTLRGTGQAFTTVIVCRKVRGRWKLSTVSDPFRPPPIRH